MTSIKILVLDIAEQRCDERGEMNSNQFALSVPDILLLLYLLSLARCLPFTLFTVFLYMYICTIIIITKWLNDTSVWGRSRSRSQLFITDSASLLYSIERCIDLLAF